MKPGFLAWYRQNPEVEATLHPEVEAAQVRREYQQAILLAGGNQQTLQACDEVMYQEIFGCTQSELYCALSLKPGDRDALPATAQIALTMAEMAATEEIYRELAPL